MAPEWGSGVVRMRYGCGPVGACRAQAAEPHIRYSPAPLGGSAPASHKGTPRYSTRLNASAGLSLDARQPPNAPAIRPPATARATAIATVVALTGAVRATSSVLAAACRPGPPKPPPGPPAPPPPPPNWACSVGLMAVTTYAPARPRAMPSAPPSRPLTIASPTTCRVTRP